MSHFCLLREPQAYAARDWDLISDAEGRAYWLDLFQAQLKLTCEAAMACYGRHIGGKVLKFRESMTAALDRLRAEPGSLPGGQLSLIDLDQLREDELRKHKIDDPYLRIKQNANDLAIKAYPALIRRLDDLEPADRWLEIVRCVFAGNIFDLGAPESMKYAKEHVDFASVLAQLPPRPWLVDNFDELAKAANIFKPQVDWSRAVIFVDNAGPDFVLGVMPFARELALAGVRIVLAANERASLNDITADEAAAVVERLAPLDQDLADLIRGGMFEVVSTGTALPLLDLSNVSDELNEASRNADLVVLEGMGRAVETNRTTPFTVDALRLCMIKNSAVAARVGGKNLDVVCGYVRAGA
jgi:type II pantothenate kinase